LSFAFLFASKTSAVSFSMSAGVNIFTLSEVLRFVDQVQSNLKGFGITLKFTTID